MVGDGEKVLAGLPGLEPDEAFGVGGEFHLVFIRRAEHNGNPAERLAAKIGAHFARLASRHKIEC